MAHPTPTIPTIPTIPAAPATPTYVICLDKTRAKRCDPTLAAWTRVAETHHLDVKPLQAITPDDFELREVVHPYAYSCIRRRERKTLEMIGADVEVACALSHIKAWRQVVQDQQPGIVVEDDMAMPTHQLHAMLNQLKTMPKDTDLYLLHFIGINLESTKMSGGFLDVKSFAGLQAYYITPSCAAKLLEHALPIVFQVDTYVPRAREMYGLKIRTRKENRMSFLKFARDNLRSTLGRNHVSSVMFVLVIVVAAMLIVIVALVTWWAVQSAKRRGELRSCEKTALRLKRHNQTR
jgi:GR25 family glycosyltransferase involved in LPS biosynthesis